MEDGDNLKLNRYYSAADCPIEAIFCMMIHTGLREEGHVKIRTGSRIQPPGGANMNSVYKAQL